MRRLPMLYVLAAVVVGGCPGPEAVPPGSDGGLDAPGGDVPGPTTDAPAADGPGVDASDPCADRDRDGDGVDGIACGGSDCDDADPTRAPGRLEACDAADHDEDCDPTTYGARDADGDGHDDAACCNDDGAGGMTCGDDCDDTRPDAYAGLIETCDSRDNDCDTRIDEGVTQTVYRDLDGDGHGDALASTVAGCTVTSGFTTIAGDCDDSRADRNPGTVEACDGVDNDCDTAVDEMTGTTHYRDADADGLGTPTDTVTACAPPPGYVTVSGDCDDTRADVGTGFAELCDGIDNDCDGARDEGGTNTFWQDADDDGFGDAGRSIVVSSCTPPAFHVANPSDCNDGDPAVHPGATEICDGLDNDCSRGRAGMGIDAAEDRDGDMHSAPGVTCVGGFPIDDCNDGNAALYPGAVEVCDGLDTDCSSGGGVLTSEDADGDGYAAPTAACTGGPLPRTDCNDGSASVRPGAPESCDRIDSDCSVGGGAEVGEDADGDMHAPVLAACAGGFPRDDCNDLSAASYTGAAELCDRIDNDCSAGGGTDVGEDADADGHAPTTATCSGGSLPRDDCNDAAPSIHPGATEVCDRLDQNCSSGGGIDTTEDADGDMHAAAAATCVGGFPRDDCNDASATVFPGATEACDGIDGNCSAGGGADPAEDADGDRHAPSTAACTGGPYPRDDCDDTAASTYTGAPELCNGRDDDCSSGGGALLGEDADGDLHAPIAAACAGGSYPRDDCDDARAVTYGGAPEICDRIDNDCSSGGGPLSSEDVDDDGHAATAAACSGGPRPRDDCDDLVATTYAGAPELCNRVDDDCSSGGGVLTSEDADADGHSAIAAACAGGTLPRDDCDDTSASIYPGSFGGPPRIVAPANGEMTGSFLAAGSRRPTFRWAAPPGTCGAVTYEIEIDDSCATPGFAGCAFPSPEASSAGIAGTSFTPASDLPIAFAPPVGRRYYWRVRACGVLGTCVSSPVRYLDVGRVRCDINGDGHSDVMLGRPLEDGSAVGQGYVQVMLADASGNYPGGASTSLLSGAAGTANANFGRSIACGGDVNADGFGDFVVGAPGAGRAYVYEGDPTTGVGLSTTIGSIVGGRAGTDVAIEGDVDGDGFSDVVIGAPGDVTPGGQVYLHLGSATGVSSSASATRTDPGAEFGAGFGTSVAIAGDVNGDGRADVVVGAPMQDAGAADEGNVFVFHGTASGVSASFDARLDCPLNQAGGDFGRDLAAAGDVDGDGYADVIVGAVLYDGGATDSGSVFVHRGGASSLAVAPSTTVPGAATGDRFGDSVSSAGDVNRDGFDDVIIGAPDVFVGTGNREGVVYVHHGAAGGIPTAPTTTMPSNSVALNYDFGEAVAELGDADGDGFGDVLIGDDRRERVMVHRGSASGVSLVAANTLIGFAGVGFGSALASAPVGPGRGPGEHAVPFRDAMAPPATSSSPRRSAARERGRRRAARTGAG